MNSEPILLTVKELAGLLRVSTHTIYYWVSRSEIPYVKVGKHLRFDRNRVLTFFQDQTERGTCISSSHSLLSSPPSWSLKTKHADLAYSQKE